MTNEEAAILLKQTQITLARSNGKVLLAEALRLAISALLEQKHGEWMCSSDCSEGICSVCHYKIYGSPYQGRYFIVPYNFCPNCGADMRGETSE